MLFDMVQTTYLAERETCAARVICFVSRISPDHWEMSGLPANEARTLKRARAQRLAPTR
jgi:hypothetical protein